MFNTIDAIRGMDFLRNSNGKYYLATSNNADGTISIALIRDNEDEQATFTGACLRNTDYLTLSKKMLSF